MVLNTLLGLTTSAMWKSVIRIFWESVGHANYLMPNIKYNSQKKIFFFLGGSLFSSSDKKKTSINYVSG